MMLRTFLVTLAALLIGLPASIALTTGIAHFAGMAGEDALFMVVIASSILWTLVLFVTLWFALRERVR